MSNKLNELLSSIIGELKEISSTDTIVGKPVKFGEKQVIPVSRLMLGFGIGGGEGSSEDKGSGFGGGGGGGMRIEPVGFIVIDGEKVSFLPTKQGKFEGLVEAIPGFIEKVKSMKSDKKDNQPKDKSTED